MGFLSKLFDAGRKELKRCQKIANLVMAYEEEYNKTYALNLGTEYTEEEYEAEYNRVGDLFKAKTESLKERYKNGESLDSLLPESYALVRRASTIVTGLTPYYVQVCGAIAIHGGNIAEMKTGEGKTLTAVMPAYLNALNGDGVHIVTVNEYLADREANGEIGKLFRYMGLTVGLNLRDIDRAQKRDAYKCDILYSTHSELGFDYLRDNMVFRKEDLVQRELNYAIIDEVDSILIDEARTPLIISGGEKADNGTYIRADRFVKSLDDPDYEIDVEKQTISLSESGMQKAESYFGLANIFDIDNVEIVHRIDNALKANYIFRRDKDYMVSEEGEVNIIDQFTGRVLKGRQWSEGLHQAVEAKEGVEIKKETITVATITYQNYFRMYKKLSGMTGTAKTEEEEFRNIYNMYVVEVPTNRPVIRKDYPDYLFASAEAKYNYMLNDIKKIHETGQPILIGTIAVETSEYISSILSKNHIKHEVLNAKNHAREAEIIAKAGQKGSVTIATNMAGRGTDIKLGEGVVELGGLAIVGTERHESRRIDNQLRGRSGRQGDPGESRFYISADDELLVRFGGDSFKKRIQMLVSLGSGDLNAPLESKMFSNVVTNAQKRIEGNNFDSRKNVLKYDEVLRKQREMFYGERREIIMSNDVTPYAKKMMEDCVDEVVDSYMEEVSRGKFRIDDEKILEAFNGKLYPPNTLNIDVMKTLDEKEMPKYVLEQGVKTIEAVVDKLPNKEQWLPYEQFIILRVLTSHWTEHIDSMDELRQSVRLQSYAQQNPLILYQEEGYRRFEKMMSSIKKDVTRFLTNTKVQVEMKTEHKEEKYTTNQGNEDKLKKNPAKKPSVKKPGPNEPCWCGSGKKYKYCHGARHE